VRVVLVLQRNDLPKEVQYLKMLNYCICKVNIKVFQNLIKNKNKKKTHPLEEELSIVEL